MANTVLLRWAGLSRGQFEDPKYEYLLYFICLLATNFEYYIPFNFGNIGENCGHLGTFPPDRLCSLGFADVSGGSRWASQISRSVILRKPAKKKLKNRLTFSDVSIISMKISESKVHRFIKNLQQIVSVECLFREGFSHHRNSV